jgi:hypothetical protein
LVAQNGHALPVCNLHTCLIGCLLPRECVEHVEIPRVNRLTCSPPHPSAVPDTWSPNMERVKRRAFRMARAQRRVQREEKELRITEEWENAVKLEEIVIPEEFSKTPAMRLWYMARCGAQGQFTTTVVDLSDPSLQMAQDPWSGAMYSPWNRLLRRISIAAQLTPLIFPSLVQLVWETAGPRILVQFAAEIACGLCKSLW